MNSVRIISGARFFVVAGAMAIQGFMQTRASATNQSWLQITAITNYSAAIVIHVPDDDTNAGHDLFYATNLSAPVIWNFLMRTPSTNVLVPNLRNPITFLALGQTNGDLTVSTNATPLQLAQELVGPNVTLQNVTYTGSLLARGIFSGGNGCGLPIENGVILSTGNITNAPGPNNDDGSFALVNDSSAMNTPGDDDLDSLTGGGPTQDAAVLEFDMTSPSNSLTLEYVFASEEYPEYIDQFNDPVAIFIDGTNIALVPFTTTPVTINTVNGGFDDGSGNVIPPANPQYYVDNADPFNSPPDVLPAFNIQYDGMTVLLTARAQISTGVSHHVKIAIADYSDEFYDSAIFIKAWPP
jgi:hypothetical protein